MFPAAILHITPIILVSLLQLNLKPMQDEPGHHFQPNLVEDVNKAKIHKEQSLQIGEAGYSCC